MLSASLQTNNALLMPRPRLPWDTILLAEEFKPTPFLLGSVLRKLNKPYRVEMVGSGEAVVNYLSGRGIYSHRSVFPFPALLLLDMKLGGIGAAGVLEWLRRNAMGERLLVTLLSDAGPKLTGQVSELRSNVSVMHSGLLHPPTEENVGVILSFFERWKQSQFVSGLSQGNLFAAEFRL